MTPYSPARFARGSEEISGLIDSVGGLSDALEALRAMTKAEKQN